MVKSAERRIKKYKANVDGAAVGRAIKALKEIMVDQQRSYFPQMSLLEMKVKKVVEAAGIPVQQIPAYLAVARKCYHVANKFSQATRDAEAQNIVDLWTSRGLNSLLTSEVCSLTGCQTTGVAPPTPAEEPMVYMPELRADKRMVSLYVVNREGLLTENTWEGSIVAQLFPLTRRTRFSQISFYGNRGPNPTLKMRLAVYGSDGNAFPDNLILDAGEITLGVGSTWYDKAINLTLEQGIYFLAWQADRDDGNARTFPNYVSPLQIDQALGSTRNLVGMIGRDVAYGPFPDPFGAPDWMWDYIWLMAMTSAQVF